MNKCWRGFPIKLGCTEDFVSLKTIFQSFRDIEAGDIQFLKSKWRDRVATDFEE